MIITAANFISWPVAAWLGVAGMLVMLAWWKTNGVQPPWLRVFYQASVMALCFTPVPHILMFLEEGARAGVIIVTPLWYAFYCAVVQGVLPLIGIVLTIWFVATYCLWVAGMTIHHLVRGTYVRSCE